MSGTRWVVAQRALARELGDLHPYRAISVLHRMREDRRRGQSADRQKGPGERVDTAD